MVSENECRKKYKRMHALKGTINDIKKKIPRKNRTFGKIEKETRKRQFKCYNITFGKKRMKAINRVEHRDNRVLIQVMSKTEVERVIMKENEMRFQLA